jgi:hypothetical protein
MHTNQPRIGVNVFSIQVLCNFTDVIGLGVNLLQMQIFQQDNKILFIHHKIYLPLTSLKLQCNRLKS